MTTTKITNNRVITASFFLPYTVDVELVEKKGVNTPTILEPVVNASTDVPDTTLGPRNLIDTLAAQKRNPTPQQNQQELFTLKSQNNTTLTDSTLGHEMTETTMVDDNKSDNKGYDDMGIVWEIKPCISGNIGLQNAIHSVRHRLNQLVWVGTLGTSSMDCLSKSAKENITSTLINKYDSYPIIPNDAVFDGHYNRYCKQILWPYFHYVVQDDIQNKMHHDDPWKHYVNLNQQFAETIANIYQEGDIIWVNDYHLMLLPGMLREKLPNAIIGFFMHIPFPSSELFRCLPSRKQLLEGMLQSDLIGFQTYSFARHFLQTCSRILSLDTTPSGIQMDSHYVAVGMYPIGIDIAALNKKRENPDVTSWMAMLKEKYAGKKLIVARDKLDYVKGVRQKLLAFEQFLIRHPEWRGKVVLIQIALSTSEQNELRAHISDVVSRVNSKFSNISYQPIVFLHQDISFPQYLALLTSADASLITPLRDGMNLTSHEYIVCQENRYNPLILSEFTGTYGSFGACLRVNPWDYRQIGDAIHEALSMSKEEKQSRWNELYKSIEANSAQNFATSIISELSKVHSATGRRFSARVPPLELHSLKTAFQRSKKRVFLFDYGGTLVTHGKTASGKELDRLTSVLTKLTGDPRNAVYVISGRTRLEVERDLGEVPNLGLSAENGFYIKPRGEGWQSLFEKIDLSWKPAVKEIFQYYTERTPGAYIETKETSIVWHYRTTPGPDAQYVAWQAAECQNHIADSVNKNFAVHAVAGRTNIEVMPHEINKSGIANRVLQDIQPDFILSIGDDRTDEDMFAFLNKQKVTNTTVVTCTVGSRSTEAQYYINNVDQVMHILDGLSTPS
ncbi:glycosyltransferase family 20-domain-containing protein [Halteromyces radiatus]|uniref:glycosyltransferase family 20-domain-containing protein n=1 Tax=Halteromyces radiatus TaxID=101107 RepID=UPI00221F0478|nr:glycosyltransferase family 20-domain-containing protein [Halteromyces radiatus]KAI8084885.1 glycosyltransferase family 20-domain-containing protein [Halteromyces radiatus]